MAQGIDIITKLAYIEKLTGEKYALAIPMNQLDDGTYSGTSEIELDGYKIIIQEEWENRNQNKKKNNWNLSKKMVRKRNSTGNKDLDDLAWNEL